MLDGAYNRVVGNLHLVDDDGAESEDEHQWTVQLGGEMLM